MNYTVTFMPDNLSVSVPENATIMDAERMLELGFEYPCGGNGTCGKCMVDITYDDNKTVSLKACTTRVDRDMTVTLKKEKDTEKENILIDSEIVVTDFKPGIRVLKLSVPEAKVGDVRSDFERFKAACSEQFSLDGITFNSVSVLSRMSEIFAEDIFEVYGVFFENILLDVLKEDVHPLGLSYDVGTTTIACYLTDLKTGKQIDSAGDLNRQVKYGGDVVSRCLYAMEHGVAEIKECVNEQVDELAEKILKKNKKRPEEVYVVSVVGNTCMHHIFAGIKPLSLVNVPYTPSENSQMVLAASDYLKNANKNAKLLLLPVIAGFIGADTVSAIVATEFYNSEKPTLLLDIGTNGEMVLGTKERWVACSTASGPAFEGAKIEKGMRGAPGAIDHVWMDKNELKYSTIEALPAAGICGSGLIDIITLMLSEGIILPSGRLNRRYPEDGPLYDRLQTVDGINVFVIAPEVYVTQKDVREVQLAKGAIAAGIEIMTEALSLTYEDIQAVLIAGAFGNYMKPESMCGIKMLPPTLLSKIKPVGNAAGRGATVCLLSDEKWKKSEEVSRRTEFIELATHPQFQSKFISQLDF